MSLIAFLVPALLMHAAPAPKVKIHDIKVGKGVAAKAGDRVSVNYTGTFTNGTVFDSSEKPGRTPFEFTIGAHEVIEGWDQGVAGMKVGGARKLTIPYQLAYGEAGRPGIPPKATLIFIVKLMKITHAGK